MISYSESQWNGLVHTSDVKGNRTSEAHEIVIHLDKPTGQSKKRRNRIGEPSP